MKTTLYFTITLLTFVTLAFVPNSFAQDTAPEYVVRVIYFIPKDREPDPNMDEKLDTTIKEAQQFYAAQMEAHGFGGKTFRFEADENENVVVHHVNGKFNDLYYQDPTTGSWIVWNEIEELFDVGTSKNIYLLALEISSEFLDGSFGIFGKAIGSPLRGRVLVPASNFDAVVHELGHAFGLVHDGRYSYRERIEDPMFPVFEFNDAKWIFATPFWRGPMPTSFCAAEWLDVSRYFNPTHETFNLDTRVKVFPLSLAAPPDNIRLQFEVIDPDGLHQVQLLVPQTLNNEPDLPLSDFRSLNGNISTAEFVNNDVVISKSITLLIIDKHGNFTSFGYSLDDVTELLPPPKVISMPDPKLAAIVREELGLASASPITHLDMLELRELIAINNEVENLTGIEHAKHLNTIFMDGHWIKDLSPLSKLTNLRRLVLGGNPVRGRQISNLEPIKNLRNLNDLRLANNQISDITVLLSLNNIETLHLSHNPISDISPVWEMTQLRFLQLHGLKGHDISPLAKLTKLEGFRMSGVQVSDLTPLASLTNLRFLFMQDNQISDVTPLTRLVKLSTLHLSGNQVSDLTPLAGLTNLFYLYLENNQISDVTPLTGLLKLRKLHLQGNPIKNRKPLLELLQKNPDVKIYLERGGEPLPVTLSHFRAELTDSGVVLNWTTESEVDNAGFYIYRSETKGGEFKVVNPTLIQGAGTTGERNTYTWTDKTTKPNVAYYYRIEDVSQAGVHKQLATVRMRGLISASGKLTTRWADLKTQE